MEHGVFIPDRDRSFYLLARHRQPLAENVTRKYIEEWSAPGDLIIDPFAASPTVARVGVELGRRVIAVDSNPLVAFAARFQAVPPGGREIKAALARLGEIQKEDESLKAHLEGLYASVCANCGAPVIVDYFVHSVELKAPVDKVYRCLNCGLRRDPTNDDDRSRAAEIKPRGFHYHLLMERISGSRGEHAAILRELLKLYTPRNLYALVSITLKVDAEIKDEAVRQILTACLIHALDVGTTLYASPGGLPQRKTPEPFVEMNVWRSLETAAEALSAGPRGVIGAASSPQEVVSASAPAFFVGQGTAHSLAATISTAGPMVISSPARLDPLFWQLSYLWSSWTLGKQAAAPLEPLLDPEHQRWGWYGNALSISLREAARLMDAGGRLVFAFPSGSHAMIEALCLAAAPFFRLESLAFRPSPGAAGTTEFGAVRGDYRAVWRREDANAAPKEARDVAPAVRRDALIGATEILASRGEPLAYSWIHHAALRQLAGSALAEVMAAKMAPRDNPFQFLRHQMEGGLKSGYARDFDHWSGPGGVLWVRRQSLREGVPLGERVERAVLGILAAQKQISRFELEDRILEEFAGLLTPEKELVEYCAKAYADEVGDAWQWREVDGDSELARSKTIVSELGERLGLVVRPGEAGERFDLVWSEQKLVPASSAGSVRAVRVPEDSHGFVFPDRPDLLGLVRTPATPLQGVVLIPESQVELTKEKLRRIPMLEKLLRDAGWEFLRLPFAESLLASSTVERPEFQLGLGLDPPLAKGKEQMELF